MSSKKRQMTAVMTPGNKNHVITPVASPPNRSTAHSSQPMAKKDVDVSRVPITVHRTANTVKAAPMLSQSILRVRGSLS